MVAPAFRQGSCPPRCDPQDERACSVWDHDIQQIGLIRIEHPLNGIPQVTPIHHSLTGNSKPFCHGDMGLIDGLCLPGPPNRCYHDCPCKTDLPTRRPSQDAAVQNTGSDFCGGASSSDIHQKGTITIDIDDLLVRTGNLGPESCVAKAHGTEARACRYLVPDR